MEKMFLLKTEIHQFTSVREFFESQKLTKSDLIITNRFMAEGKLKGYIKNASVIFQEEYGNGEPTDQMVMAIKKDMPNGTQTCIVTLDESVDVTVGFAFMLAPGRYQHISEIKIERIVN